MISEVESGEDGLYEIERLFLMDPSAQKKVS